VFEGETEELVLCDGELEELVETVGVREGEELGETVGVSEEDADGLGVRVALSVVLGFLRMRKEELDRPPKESTATNEKESFSGWLGKLLYSTHA
jgi:hypothetical protein